MKKAGGGSLTRIRDSLTPFSEMVKKNITLKRRLDDSCLDDSIETPTKNPCIPSTASPDLGLGCDSFNVDTPENVSQQGPLKRQRKTIRRLTEDGLTGLKAHLNLASSSETSDGTPPIDVTVRNSPPSSSNTVNHGDGFHFNIDNILDLSPINCNAGPATCTANYVKDCLCHRSHSPSALNPTAGQQIGAGERWEEPSANKSEGNRTSSGAAAAVQVNGGHLSQGPLQFPREVGGSSQPLLKPLKLHQDVRAVLGTISAPSAPSRAVAEALDFNEEMGCGAPLLESTVREGAGLEEAHTVENSFEDSLPLKQQVRSVVAVGNRHGSRETAQALRKRPMPFHSDWSQKKHRYVDSISRHTQDNSYHGNNKSRTAMTELLHLRGALGEKHWQHPSDLTTRNHQKRFGNSQGPRMSLAEWKAQSSRTHQGFSMVPLIFQRSPVP